MTAPAVDRALLETAVALATEAGELTLQWFNSSQLEVDLKGDGSPVTQADRGAEALIRERLAELYPDDTVLGEEHPDTTGTSGRQWIIDPIDGTKSFTHGVPLYSNLIAMIDEHGPAIGVVNLPALGEMVWAGRGLGCFHNGEPTSVSTVSELQGAAVCASGFEGIDPARFIALNSSGAIVRTWGDGYGYFLVATGRVEAMIDYDLHPWDIAPMHVIIAEAGGTLTAWDGSPEPMQGMTLSTNGHIHETLRRLLL